MENDPEMKIEKNVIFGKDDYLFLASDRHFTVDVLLGRKKIEKSSIKNFQENLTRRAVLSRRVGAKYTHLVAPDKHVVLRDKFPLPDFHVISDNYKDSTIPSFLYPIDELRSIGGGYEKTDTHWNVRGQIAITELLARSYGFDFASVAAGHAELLDGVRFAKKPSAGDLGVKLVPNQTEIKEIYQPSWKTHIFSNQMKTGNDGKIRILFSQSPYSKGRLLIFGDSFIAQMLTMLSIFFKEIVFCRTRFFHPEVAVAVRPNFILTENVERYLLSVQSDNEALPMFFMAQMAGHQVHYSERDLEAFCAIMSPGSRRYKNFIETLHKREFDDSSLLS